MSDENSDVQTDASVDRGQQAAATDSPDRGKRPRLWLNWALAVLTVLGAGAVTIFAIGSVMSTAACSTKACPNIGPNWVSPDVLFYGPWVVAALTIIVSFFTAKRRWGTAVPVVALALLAADVGILAATVAQ